MKSDNSVYIQLAMDLGPLEVKKTARDMGITSTLKGYPAETLGGLENGVSPLEMATAYASIASGGYRLRPTAIKKITFPDGRVEEGRDLPARFRVKKVRIFEDGVAAEATEILEQNIQGGTGTHAAIGCPAAGKTGTTDNNTDAWFVGFTPRLATAVWVGYPKDDIQMNGLYNGANVDGGTFPADIWGDYMGRIKGSFCGGFAPPEAPVRGLAVLRQVRQVGRIADGRGRTGRQLRRAGSERGGRQPRRSRHGRHGRPGRSRRRRRARQGHGLRSRARTRRPRRTTPETVEPPPSGPDGGAEAPG